MGWSRPSSSSTSSWTLGRAGRASSAAGSPTARSRGRPPPRSATRRRCWPTRPIRTSPRGGPDVEEFARLVPEVSHREPAPSDRDPIPAPFDNTYNKPERNHFHTAIKYHRDDAFFVEHIADDATRRRLDQAWTDLLTSFDYHDANLKFVSKKFGLEPRGQDDRRARPRGDRPAAGRAPAVRAHLRDEYDAMHAALRDAEPGHVEDALRFAERAWRRPLTADEAERLRDFYAGLRRGSGLDHERAIRALLARILVAPAFLYRAEPPEAGRGGIVPLTDWQLASRLSYFLWSSMPDEPLREAAAAGRLREPAELERQARRMLRDPKAPPARDGVLRPVAGVLPLRPVPGHRRRPVPRVHRPAPSRAVRGGRLVLRTPRPGRPARRRDPLRRLLVPEPAARRALRDRGRRARRARLRQGGRPGGASPRGPSGDGGRAGGHLGAAADQRREARRLGAPARGRHAGSAAAGRRRLDPGRRRARRRPDGAAAAGGPPHERVVRQLPRAHRPARLRARAVRPDRPLARRLSRRASRSTPRARSATARPFPARRGCGTTSAARGRSSTGQSASSSWVTPWAGPRWSPTAR